MWRTPQILPWSTWLEREYLNARAAATDPTSIKRVLSAAQSRALWEDVVAESAYARELLNPSNAARLAARSWRRLHEYLIPLDALGPYDTPEARALETWCRAYAARCRTLRAIDEAELTTWAHDEQFVPAEDIACAGFDSMPPSMRRLIDRWRVAGRFVDLEANTRKANEVLVIGADDAEDELIRLASWSRAQVVAGVERIGIILGDLQRRRDEVQRALEDVFAPGERSVGRGGVSIPVVVAAPSPLANYPLVDAALLVLQLATTATHNEAGRLLRSPFVAGGVSERSARALADFRLRKEQRERWDWFELERWASMTGCDVLQRTARRVNEMLRTFSGLALASEWAERFQALWIASGWPGERTLNSLEHQTLEKVRGALAEFGTLDNVAGRMSLPHALARLRDVCAETPFEPESVGAAVTVIDAATSAGMQFDALWVAGLDAEHLPAPINPDTLIPIELQRRAGIPEATPAGVLDQAAAQLQRWLRSTKQLVLSWPKREGDAELQLSPLVSQLGIDPHTSDVTPRATSLSELIFTARPSSLEQVLDDTAPPIVGAASGGARTIELQSRCAFRAQAELRLRAEPLPRVSLGVEPMDRGAILHRVLEDIWGGLRTHDRLIATDVEELERRVRESAQRHAARSIRPDTRHRIRLAALEIESVVRQVMRLLDVERARPPFAVRFAEASETYSLGGLTITLRPDRIDELSMGGALLIDYKLGDSHRPRDWIDVLPGRPRRPQLPLYGLAHADRLRALAYVVLAPGAVEYRGWSDGADVGAGVAPYPYGIRTDLGDPADWTALLHHWRFTLTRLAEHYVAGDARVDPLPQECATCHLSTLCRIHELSVAHDEPTASNGARDE